MTLTLYFKNKTGAVVCADLYSVRKIGDKLRIATHNDPHREQIFELDDIEHMDWSCQDVKPATKP